MKLSLLALLAALAACANEAPVTTTTLPHAAPKPVDDRAARFGDNPMTEFAPADTPYAFASFKPFPLAVLRKLVGVSRATWTKLAAEQGDSPLLAAVLRGLVSFDPDKLDELGLTPHARFAVYGLGPYPVGRYEIENGDKVLTALQHQLATAGKVLPEPATRNQRRYWIVPEDGGKVALFAIGPKEIVGAFAPRAVIEANLAALLGEARPPAHLDAAVFRTLARRDGFTGQGVGFVDFARILGFAGPALEPTCRDMLAVDLANVPRLAIGYDDVTERHLGLGVVVELSPALTARLGAIETQLPGLGDALVARPAMLVGSGVDLAAAQHLAIAAIDEATRLALGCSATDVSMLADLRRTLDRPAPPGLAGLRGAFAVFDQFTKSGAGALPSSGYARLEYADTADVLALVNRTLRTQYAADAAPRPLPAVIPIPRHVAASATAIALGLGADSSAKAVDALDGNGSRAKHPGPLALFALDFARLGELLPEPTDPVEAERREASIATFGMMVAKVVVDARGLAITWSTELR